MTFTGADIQEALPRFSPNTSVFKLLLESLRNNGNKVFQVDSQTGKSETFEDFLHNSCSIAAELRSRGVGEGSLVALCCEKSSAAFSIFLATMFTGATAVLISPLAVHEIHNLIKNHSLKIVFYDSLYRDSVKHFVEQTSSPTLISTEEVTMTMLKSTNQFILFDVKDVKKHIPLILFTSGSTGTPKGVQVSDIALQRYGYVFDDESIESFLLTSSFSWISNPISVVSSILKGYTVILSNSKEPRDHYLLIQKYQVDMWLVPGTMVSRYIKEPTLSQVDLSSLKEVIIGGEVLMPRVTETFISKVLQSRIGVKNLYGMTEIGVVSSWRGKDPLDPSKLSSCGCLAPGVEFKVTDEEGNELGTDECGFLWVKSISQMTGYWDTEDCSNQPIGDNGFIRTGDVGYFDSEGFLYVTGRKSDLKDIKSHQDIISDIEDVLKAHPDILEAAIVAKPKSHDLAAFIVKLAASTLNEQDIIHLVTEQFKEQTLCGGIFFIDKIPRTVNTKVCRKDLQDMLL